MKSLIIISSLLLSLGASGWFGWTYYKRDTNYRQLGDQALSLSEEKTTLSNNLEQDQKLIKQSASLESLRFTMETGRNQMARMEEELNRIRNSGQELEKLQEEQRQLEEELAQKNTP